MPIQSIKSGTLSRSTAVGNAIILPGDFESIATATGTGSSGTITFNNIPQTFTHLQLRFTYSATSSPDFTRIRFNNNSSTSYYSHALIGSGSSAAAAAYAGSSYTAALVGITVYPSGTTMGVAVMDILDYASTNKNKTTKTLIGYDANGSGAIELCSGLWSVTPEAITRIDIIGNAYNFTTNSHFALYGIRG